jgi:hypothetical protein
MDNSPIRQQAKALLVCYLSMLFIAGCASSQKDRLLEAEQHHFGGRNTIKLTSLRSPQTTDMVAGYIPEGECPNWDEALAIAKRKLGCTAGSPAPSEECQEALPCDVCQFLKEGAWPKAVFKNFPGEEEHGKDTGIRAAIIQDIRWRQGVCPVNDETHVEFLRSLCYDNIVLGFDRVDTLAKAMVHESLHLCRYLGVDTPATRDLYSRDYLFCAIVYGKTSLDADDVTNLCWEPAK